MRRGPVGSAGLLVLLVAVSAGAQISPGPLSRVHAELEGSASCLRCHDSSRGVATEKCLACHKALQLRIAAGRGLHARPDYGDCKHCHVEHQGRDFELVYWGQQGRRGFDHALTGHRLEGRHAPLACERCHRPPVYVGASTACGACHADEHRGQFKGRACSDCHGQVAWKPAAGFDHARTRWPLSGRHAGVACDRCHGRRQPDPAQPGKTFVAFRTVAGSDCVGCHEDIHRGRLGTGCGSCHTMLSWHGRPTGGFDHARTRYPLEGRHAAVACERCHPPGRPLRVAFRYCTDCHRDPHAGEPARTVEAGRCERCHDVNGYRPARFGVEEHARTAYPLTGAHLAVACDACHKTAERAPGVAMPLRLAARRCAECHADPHHGELARLVERSGCEVCHRVESWRQVAFDHGSTGYALDGRHGTVGCNGCHLPPRGSGPAVLRFTGLKRACESCHRDAHAGQFAAGGATACERCHGTVAMRPARFDHQRDSRYALDGAHARLACAACHRSESRAEASFVRYKPLPITCSGCHGPTGRPAKGEQP
ncbi:MAG TPA: hypothetical protein VEQ10_12265 [Vicinamibacteria bacterium]|nr:hypothetical protein [Vicinamibacteria bacterium]